MKYLRWFFVEIGIAALLLVAGHGILWLFAGQEVVAQTATPTAQPRIPAPPANWFGEPALSPAFNAPAVETTPEPSLMPTPTPAATPTATAETTPESAPAAEVQNSTEISDTETSNAETGESEPVTTTGTLTGTEAITVSTAPTYYVVLPGDTLFVIANDFGTTVEAMMAANQLTNADILRVGQVLLIPGSSGDLPDPALLPAVVEEGALTQTVIVPRGTITERMTSLAQQTPLNSPYKDTTWLTYYGRPNIDVMGILGEFPIEELIPILRAEADAYDRANGDSLAIQPAFHLVYGMATKAAGDGTHLAFMEDAEVMAYIEAAEAEGWGVILDVQIGALSPSEAISQAFPYLEHANVHLAIDPEFALVHPGQTWPGNPIGYVTGDQVNEVQAKIQAYLDEHDLPGPRILLVHQFQSNMIVEPEKMDTSQYPQVALTVSVDGWGGPWAKISKYNSMVTSASPYSAFKLFYRWDEPLLQPDEVFGNVPYADSDFFMDVTPNFIIFQ